MKEQSLIRDAILSIEGLINVRCVPDQVLTLGRGGGTHDVRREKLHYTIYYIEHNKKGSRTICAGPEAYFRPLMRRAYGTTRRMTLMSFSGLKGLTIQPVPPAARASSRFSWLVSVVRMRIGSDWYSPLFRTSVMN